LRHVLFRLNKALTFIAVLAVMMGQSSGIQAESLNSSIPRKIPSSYPSSDQIIVKYRNAAFVQGSALHMTTASMVEDRIKSLNSSSGAHLSHHRFMSGDGHVLKLPQKISAEEMQNVIHNLRNNRYVEYAEPDVRMFASKVPDDAYYSSQWHYHSSDSEPSGINLPAAWDLSTGLSTTIVAVIDTGIVAHADLNGRTVPGYDFISNVYVSNDGNGRDSDPSDPGDWVTSAESANSSNFFYGCEVSNSSWHGTHVAGTIAALTNNGMGVAGINWSAKILPVRVLGKCGGYLSDIIDGMRWAAGLSVYGAPTNPNPARILNLSLGGSGSCSSVLQSAVSEIMAAGAVIVAAAGNESGNASSFTPANCSGVVSVAALNRWGGRASYSNYGSVVKIAAPGGDGASGILSTLNTGTTAPAASPAGDTYAYYQGTSMATPHVSGVASLILALSPSLTSEQVIERLQSSARPFPSGSSCTTSICGAGIVNAAAAVAADVGISMTVSPESASTGQLLTYAITVTSNGPGPADSVTVTDNLPDGLSFSSASPSQGSCSSVETTVTCSLGKIDSGSSATISLTVIPGIAGTISNTVSVATIIHDVDETNNSATQAISVHASTAMTGAPATGGVGAGGGGGGGGCFIATAAYGSYMEKHVNVLREFRDRILLSGPAGHAFVRFYYKYSPAAANSIVKSDALRFIVRTGLAPVVGMAYLILVCGLNGVLIMMLSLLLARQALSFGIRLMKAKYRSRPY